MRPAYNSSTATGCRSINLLTICLSLSVVLPALGSRLIVSRSIVPNKRLHIILSSMFTAKSFSATRVQQDPTSSIVLLTFSSAGHISWWWSERYYTHSLCSDTHSPPPLKKREEWKGASEHRLRYYCHKKKQNSKVNLLLKQHDGHIS